MSEAPSSGFDPSPWIAANATLAARIGMGRVRGFGFTGLDGLDAASSQSGRTITGDRDEERRRGLPGIASRGGRQEAGGSLPFGGFDGRAGASGLASSDGAGVASVSTAALLARGYQPAVVKVVSYAHGVTRATASAQYIERDEVELETHDGLRLPDKEAVAEEIKAWSSSFEKRTPSQDVVAVRVQLSGLRDTTGDREVLGTAVAAAFDGHRHAVRIDVQKDGVLEARVVALMARSVSPEEKAAARLAAEAVKRRPALPSRIRVIEARMGATADAPMRKVFDVRSEAAMKARIETATSFPQHGISIEPATPGHGRDVLGQRLATLVAKGPALDHQGKQITKADDIRDITRDWGRHLRSHTPRDTMHMVVSAKAGTDVKDFTNAVRSFLHQQFSNHKFMYGVHTDKAEAGHIHAHAIVAVRSETGIKLHPGPSDLSLWRGIYAAHARDYGLQVVATRAAEQASSRSYGPKDKSIVDVATTPRLGRREQDRAYAADPKNAMLIENARRRMEMARANPARIPMTARERQGLEENLKQWRYEADTQPQNAVTHEMVKRLNVASEAAQMLQVLSVAAKSSSLVSILSADMKAAEHQTMTKTADDMHKDLRALNTHLAEVSALLPEGFIQIFNERAGRQLEQIAKNIDHQREIEAKVNEIARESISSMKQEPEPNHKTNVQAAWNVGDKVHEAQRMVTNAIKVEHKLEAPPTSSPLDLAKAEQNSEQKNRGAKEAPRAPHSVEHDPAKPIPPALTQSERLEELRRKQAKIQERLTRERVSSRDRQHEAGE